MKPITDSSNNYPVILLYAGGKGTDNNKQLKDWNKQLAEKRVREKFPCYVGAAGPWLVNAEELKTSRS